MGSGKGKVKDSSKYTGKDKYTIEGTGTVKGQVNGTDKAKGTVKGTVKELSYFGGLTIYRVKLASGATLKVSMANTERHPDDIFTWDDEVWAHWSPQAQVVLTQ